LSNDAPLELGVGGNERVFECLVGLLYFEEFVVEGSDDKRDRDGIKEAGESVAFLLEVVPGTLEGR